MTAPDPTDLDALIADFIQAVEEGKTPDPADWLARHPAHATELASFLLDLGRFGSFLGLPSLPPLDATTDFLAPGGDSPAAPTLTGAWPFAEYEPLKKLGQGGMGTVYRVRLIPTRIVVALKRIRPGGLDGAEAVRRFHEEVETAAGLRHPNIVQIYHVGEHEGQPFYTMALVEKGSLDRHMEHFRGDLRKIARLLAQVARAVHHAHQRRILHRDLKPGNILLDEDWTPHVADFGLAVRLDKAGTAVEGGSPTGSLSWMAPEVLRGDVRLSTAVDIWALGVILYELLTGERPFRGDDGRTVVEAILGREPVAPREVNARIPRDLDAVCRRCLVKDPDQRYESANALALDLERWLRDEPVRIREAGRAERVGRWCRRNPALAVGTGCLIAWLVAGAIAALSFISEQESKLRETVRQTNTYAARQVSSAVHLRLDRLAELVSDAAGDEALLDACKNSKIAAAKSALENRFRSSPFETVYLLDSNGKLVAHMDPEKSRIIPRQPVVGIDYPGRDYFRGALRHVNEKEIRERVHLSRVFPSERDGLDKVAISCPLQLAPGKVWVIAGTITTSDSFKLASILDKNFTAVLVAPRDTNDPHTGKPSLPPGYVVLVHPGFSPGTPSVPAGRDIVPTPDGKPELRPTPSEPPFEEDDYRDPVAAADPLERNVRWLTGSARVANTELVVIVQQRYAVAVAPHQGILGQFVAWMVGTIVIGAGVFALLRKVVERRIRSRKSPKG